MKIYRRFAKKIVILSLVLLFLFIDIGSYWKSYDGNLIAYAMTQSEYDSKINAFIKDARWSNGTAWGSKKEPIISKYKAVGCCAYVCDFVKFVYGSDELRGGTKYTGVENIQAGDVLYIKSTKFGEHWIAVLGRDGNNLYTAEGSVNINGNRIAVISKTRYVIKGNTLFNDYVGTYSFEYGYHYEEIDSMTLNQSSVTLDRGGIGVLKVTSDIGNQSVTWTNSNNDVAVLSWKDNMAFVTGANPGTTTVTATCGSMKASCKVTVKGDGSETAITIKDDGVTKITENSARINATISPGMIIEEAGFYYGTSKDSLTQKKESVNSYTETIWYDLGTGKWTSALKANTTYYYQIYVKVNGTTYKTSISSFKTAQGETYTLTNAAVSKLTTTSARIKATLSPGVKIESAGFYYGTSSSKLTKKSETVNTYTESIYYDLGTGKWCSALSPNTKYYYQLYVVINGTEYKSKLSTFTTASNKLVENSDKFTSLSASDITETSAKIRAEYPKAVYDDAGFYFGTASDLASMKKTSEYAYGGTPSTSYVNSYKLGVKYDGYGYKWSDPLEAGTKYYYAFYLVLNGTEYISKVQNFTTSGTASITNVEVTSFPTKRDYVVGEKVDTSGAKLKVTYSNGKTASVTSGITVSGDASKVGTRTITLKYEGYSFKYNINVTQPLTGIKLNKTSATMDVDDVITLSVTYNPTNTTDSKDVTWKSSNTKVATVSNGMIIAVGGGTATITATCGSKTATCKVTVRIPVTGISLNMTSALLTEKGATVSLKATIAPSDAANKNVTWLSSDTSVATVSANGVVKAVGEGVATISATTESGNKTAVCIVTVDYPKNENHDTEQYPQDSQPGEYPSDTENNPNEDNPNENNSQKENPNKYPDDITNNPNGNNPNESNSQEENPNKYPDDTTNNPNENNSQDRENIIDGENPQATEDGNYIPDYDEDTGSVGADEGYIVEVPEITADDMENIVETNATQIVEITNEEGVVFTFTVGSMSMVDGLEKYDFSTEIVADFTDEETLPFTKEECVLRINYKHSGELPGTAIISIPVGTEWAGKQLYYYQVFEDGSYKYTGESAIVDAKGNFTIRQSHCSDYVISTLPPVEETKASGFYYVLVFLLATAGVGAIILVIKKRKA